MCSSPCPKPPLKRWSGLYLPKSPKSHKNSNREITGPKSPKSRQPFGKSRETSPAAHISRPKNPPPKNPPPVFFVRNKKNLGPSRQFIRKMPPATPNSPKKPEKTGKAAGGGGFLGPQYRPELGSDSVSGAVVPWPAPWLWGLALLQGCRDTEMPKVVRLRPGRSPLLEFKIL